MPQPEHPVRPARLPRAPRGPAAPSATRPRILVIKHGALGDFVQALGPFQAIRAAHLEAHLTLLTTPPFLQFAGASGWFDEIWADARPPLWRLRELAALRRRMAAAGFARVYDLQTSDRSSLYFHLLPLDGRPDWSGIARGCSHPHRNPRRRAMHTLDRQAEQLELAGIRFVPPPDVSWVKADVRRFKVGRHYALLAPGGSAHRAAKRWPPAAFAKFARLLAADGIRPVLLGSESEAALLGEIAESCPPALNLAGQTSLAEIVALARHARAAVGNDTGPMHLIAAAECPTVVLFSAASDPALCAPRGKGVAVLRRQPLGALEVDEVAAAFTAVERGGN